MTIANEDARSGPYNGDGVTQTFDYDFKLTSTDHLVITETAADGTETLLTVSSVTGLNVDGGGTFTVSTVPAVGTQVTATREVPVTQTTDLQNRGNFRPTTVMAALDKLTQIQQDLKELLRRAVKQPVTSTVELSFPAPTGNASKVLAYNAAETALEAVTANSDTYLTFPAAATDNQVARFNGTSGTSIQVSAITIDDDADVDGVRNIQMTGSIEDSNGNELLKFTVTGSAVNELTVVNAATGNAPELQATGGDTNIDLVLQPKGTGEVLAGSNPVLDQGTSRSVTAKFTETPDSDSSASGSMTIDFTNRSITTIELTENVTSLTLTGLTDGDVCEAWFRQDSTDRTVSGWSHATATFLWVDAVEPTIVSGADNVTVVQLRYDGGTNEIYGTSVDYSN